MTARGPRLALCALLIASAVPGRLAAAPRTARPAPIRPLPAPAVLALAPALIFTPISPAKEAAAPGAQLRAAAAAPSASLAGAVFDGAAARPPAPAEPAAAAPEPAAAASALRPSAPGPSPPAKPRTVERAFKNGLGLGILAASVAPVAWNVLPLHAAAYGILAGVALPALLFGAQGLWRLGRRLAGRVPLAVHAARPQRLKAAALGVLLGAALTGTAFRAMPHATETAARVAAPRLEVALVPGSVLQDEVRRTLEVNPVGREVLERLKDRGGRLRMPRFYVVDREERVAATYVSMIDGVFIEREQITAYGWTVAEFLADPAKQARFARDFQTTFLHELLHANQFRRSVFFPSQFWPHMELEFEAYLTEILYTHERLKQDPHAELGGDLIFYIQALDDLEAALDRLAASPVYRRNTRGGSRYWDSYLERVRGSWPEIQAEGRRLLALRRAPKSA